MWGDELQTSEYIDGLYWTRDLDTSLKAHIMVFYQSNPPYFVGRERYEGMTVRPVYVE